VVFVFAPALADEDYEVRVDHSAPQRRVLLVEDDCLIASLLTDEISELGYSVVGPARTLTEATAIASTSALMARCSMLSSASPDEGQVSTDGFAGALAHLPEIALDDELAWRAASDDEIMPQPAVTFDKRFTAVWNR
jgi:hypothetical protein